MTLANDISAPLQHADRFFIGGEWVTPSSKAMIDVIDSATEELFFSVAEAQEADMARAVGAARQAFDQGPWPRLTHGQRAEYLRAISTELQKRAEDIGQIWPRESGVLHFIATASVAGAAGTFDYYAGLADTFPFEEEAKPSMGGQFGLSCASPSASWARSSRGTPRSASSPTKSPPPCWPAAPSSSRPRPRHPARPTSMAEVAEAVGLPPGVLNVVTADREVSELLVRDPRVDKITFTGSTAAGRRIASICGERIARCTLELGRQVRRRHPRRHGPGHGGHHAGPRRMLPLRSGLLVADADRRHAESSRRAPRGTGRHVLPGPGGQSLRRRDADGPAGGGTAARPGRGLHRQGPRRGCHPGHRRWAAGPPRSGLVHRADRLRQRRQHVDDRAGGDLRAGAERDPGEGRADAIAIANDTIYGLNASVFTNDVERARDVARQLRSGTVGHNAFRTDFGISFGGFKQSGIGREGGTEGLLPFLETKTVILEGRPAPYGD